MKRLRYMSLALALPGIASAAPIGLAASGNWLAAPSGALQMAVLLGMASLVPGLVLACTTFARFTIVFSLLKTGLGTQGAPPSQVMVGLALFMTAFVMSPVVSDVHRLGLRPYLAGELDEAAAFEAATPPLRTFLLRHTRQKDLAVFFEESGLPRPERASDVPLRIAVPAFMLSELRTAFQMGLAVLLPFLVIDLIVASVLSSMGMVMLPPSVIALPLKLLVFVAADGWNLLVRSLLRSVG